MAKKLSTAEARKLLGMTDSFATCQNCGKETLRKSPWCGKCGRLHTSAFGKQVGAKPPCPRCGGSGDFMADNGPDQKVAVPCQWCRKTGPRAEANGWPRQREASTSEGGERQ